MVATRNRIAKHLDPPAAPAIPPKDDYKGRYEFVSDAVLRAVAAVTRLLDSDDPAVVMKAAKMILDLEKTRMRHGKEVHGVPRPESVERAALLPPLPDFATPRATRNEVEDHTPRPHDPASPHPTPSIPGEGGERRSPGEVSASDLMQEFEPGGDVSTGRQDAARTEAGVIHSDAHLARAKLRDTGQATSRIH